MMPMPSGLGGHLKENPKISAPYPEWELKLTALVHEEVAELTQGVEELGTQVADVGEEIGVTIEATAAESESVILEVGTALLSTLALAF